MTFLRAQGLLITGGLGLMHRDIEMMKEKTNETFYSTEETGKQLLLAAKQDELQFRGLSQTLITGALNATETQ